MNRQSADRVVLSCSRTYELGGRQVQTVVERTGGERGRMMRECHVAVDRKEVERECEVDESGP